MFAYAGELSGGKAFVPKAVPGVWVAKLDDGTSITVRSVSSGHLRLGNPEPRWTVDIAHSPEMKAAGHTRPLEVKFR